MLAAKIAAAVIRAVSSVAKATRKDSPGGKRITAAEADAIMEAVIKVTLQVLDEHTERKQ